MTARSLGWKLELSIAVVIFALSTLLQIVTYEKIVRPPPNIGGGAAVSAVIGHLHGRGFTVSGYESASASRALREQDLLALYRASDERHPPHEPLPATTLLFLAIAKLTGELRLYSIVMVQILAHALAAVWLFYELSRRHWGIAVLAGLSWGLFVPEWRLTLTPGYDSWTSNIYLAATMLTLCFHRTRSILPLLGAAVVCGIGLWTRSYLMLLPATILVVLGVTRLLDWKKALVFVLPVLLFAVALHIQRAPEKGLEHQYVRGAFWFTFWAGVGQFENDRGVGPLDNDVQVFARSLSPDSDFNGFFYQYDPRFNEVLREEGKRYVGSSWPSLIRNGVYRVGWTWVPVLMPSSFFQNYRAIYYGYLAVGIPLAALALFGCIVWIRKEPVYVLLLFVPVFAILPLSAYFINGKIPTGSYFAQISFAAYAVVDLWGRWMRRRASSRSHSGPS